MPIPRVFISHYTTEETQQSFQTLTKLIADLRSAGAEVVTNGGRGSEGHFTYTLDQELPKCQWLLFIQTPDALHSPKVQATVNTAIQLVSQQRMQGIIRLIAGPVNSQDVPSTWSTFTTIDISQDYPRALEKLLLALGLTGATTYARLQAAPPPASPFAMPPTYDRPPVSSSRFAFLTPVTSFIADIKSGRLSRQQRLLTVLIASLLLIIILGTTFFAFLRPLNSPPKPPAITVFGHAYFLNSGRFNGDNSQGLSDELQLDLSNLTPPAHGNAYYVWLLPDGNNFDDGNTRLLGSLALQGGSTHLKYINPSHGNLLAVGSRLLVTEESANITPANPSPKKAAWRYYAALPQIPNPADTVDHYSDLDHLRHLLVNDPTLQKLSLLGGLSIRFFQNTQKIQAWAIDAKSETTDAKPLRSLIAHILLYLDSSAFVERDFSPTFLATTPFTNADQQMTRVGLLTTDPNQPVPGYVNHLGKHLSALLSSPYSTPEQSKLAGEIDTAVNAIASNLQLARGDAQQLIHMSNAQLLTPATLSLIDDLVVQTTDAYAGQIDQATGNRQNGAIWVYDNMQQLSMFSIKKYAA